jgi:hypothetical protein
MINRFADCLRRSHAASDWPGWEALYREVFPTFAAMIDHRQDGEHQRAGIDRSIILRNSKQILVDEKVRSVNYNDILLEVYHEDGRNTPGWVVKQLRADYIAYLIAPIGKCYLLPVIQLQSAWARHGEEWTRDNQGYKRADNRGYCTCNVPVKVETLFRAMGAGLRVAFEPFDVADRQTETR